MVEIGKSVESISTGAFSGCSLLEEVRCYSSTPARIKSDTFDTDHFNKAVLYVPEGSINNYKADEYWKLFRKINEFEVPGEGGIDSVEASASQKTELCRYDLTGAAVDNGYKGVVVIVYSDGSRSKAYSKGF